MVNIINEGWRRALKTRHVLPSCYVFLRGAVEILRIPSFGGCEAGVVSLPPVQGCQEGRFSVLGLFCFRDLN